MNDTSNTIDTDARDDECRPDRNPLIGPSPAETIVRVSHIIAMFQNMQREDDDDERAAGGEYWALEAARTALDFEAQRVSLTRRPESDVDHHEARVKELAVERAREALELAEREAAE